MNPIDDIKLRKANMEAIYNVYMYLAHKTTPAENEPFESVVHGLQADLKNQGTQPWNDRDILRLNILKNAVDADAVLADSRIGSLSRSKSGMTACTFTKPSGGVSVVFRGTGSGEWIDNGEGLSGIPEENTYIIYGRNGREVYRRIVHNDYATDQQVAALNWFCSIAAKNGWDRHTGITVSGHSKGGNKAQFVALCSGLAEDCFSFDGQGFSPEALAAMKEQYGAEYEKRRQSIMSFAAANDYVSVLGEQLMPQNNIYYFESRAGIHYMEAMLDNYGRFRPQCEQGRLSEYVEMVSKELMGMPPLIRQYATLGVMNVFQKYLGEGIPVNGDDVSAEKTIAGIALALGSIIYKLRSNNE